ncbi:hypothetical protein K469DRAFT_689538 [Zopfia rhizophila CBS 207.26]|uniref:Uncharacterized protein n=1 Tax=Zopfia rhizophila CBS 207.26 TaxID=1314779 RepID=A0A6A6E253_9PEZI|nr:hypothetical protein K469DRAFT_689538 [Zopfia rhizophila CBS 207.26]
MGKPVAWCYVNDFQKGGPAHAHDLLTLARQDKIYSVQDVDATCCAEIPDKDADPELHDIVVSNMVHGHCSEQYNPDALGRGRVLRVPVRGLRASGIQALQTPRPSGLAKQLLGRSLHPYNVELTGSIKAVMYLYKYVYNGPDKATAEVAVNTDTVNEVLRCQDCRYFSAHVKRKNKLRT